MADHEDARQHASSVEAQPHAPKGRIKAKAATAELVTTRPNGTPYLMGQRCKATSKGSGMQCRQPAIPGGTVCYYHGGGAPQVRQKAAERLMALQHPAISRLEKLIAQEEFPTVAYAASRDVLDRTLGKPTETVKADVNISLARLLAVGQAENGEDG